MHSTADLIYLAFAQLNKPIREVKDTERPLLSRLFAYKFSRFFLAFIFTRKRDFDLIAFFINHAG
jgi:hypothetical protein